MTENEQTSRVVDVALVGDLAIKVLKEQYGQIKEHLDKTLINLLVQKPESFDDLPQIPEILSLMQTQY